MVLAHPKGGYSRMAGTSSQCLESYRRGFQRENEKRRKREEGGRRAITTGIIKCSDTTGAIQTRKWTPTAGGDPFSRKVRKFDKKDNNKLHLILVASSCS